jgi:outer membrane protein assembly factor BamB
LIGHVYAWGAEIPLVWEKQEKLSGGIDEARAVTVSGKTVVVAGLTAAPFDGTDLVVRAYDVESGVPRWADQTPATFGTLAPVFVTSTGHLAFVAGFTSTPETGQDILVRAYDVKTGDVLWTDLLDKGGDDTPQGIAASSNVVVVVGYGGSGPGKAIDFLVRAYDPQTGDVLWEDRVDHGVTVDDAAWAVAIDGNRVFVAGTTGTGAGRDLIVRAYGAHTGQLLWEFGRANTSAFRLAAEAGTLFVTANNFIAALKASSGKLLWSDTSTVGTWLDITAQTGRVVAVGFRGAGLTVAAFNARTGVIEWQDTTVPGPGGFHEFLVAVDVDSKAAYMAGVSGRDFVYSEVMLRAYDLKTGSLLLDARSHRGLASVAVDIAVKGDRVFVVGADDAGGALTNRDFLVQAYEAKAIKRRIKR